MINFWGIQRSFLIIRSVSSGWKIPFFRKEGSCKWAAARCYGCSWTEHTHPSEPNLVPSSSFPSLGQCWEMMSYSQVWFPILWNISAWMSHCTHVPRLQGGYQGDNVATPQHSECLGAACDGSSASQPRVETPGNSGSYWVCVLCVNPVCTSCEWREGFISACTDTLMYLFHLWRVTSWNQYADQECSEYLKKIFWFFVFASSEQFI